MSIIRNILVLFGVAITTVAAWVLCVLPLMRHQSWASSVIISTGHCGVTSYDLTITAVFAGWTFILGYLSRFLFVGSFVSWLRLASLTMSVAMFLFGQGLFMPSNLFRLVSIHILLWPLASLLLLVMSNFAKYRMPNTALEPTPVTPGSFRCGFRVGGSHRRRGSAFGR